MQAKLISGYGMNRLRKTYTIEWLKEQLELMGTYLFQLRNEIDQHYGLGTWNNFVDAIQKEELLESSPVHDHCIGSVLHYSELARKQVREQPQPQYLPVPENWNAAPSFNFTFSTQNIEKYGQATDKAPKTEQIVESMDVLRPDVATYQEVTNPQLFLQNVAPQLPDYQGLAGAAYQSHNYKESYPAFFNTATVHDPPQLFFIDPKEKEQPYKGTLYFGKEAAERRKLKDLKQARPTSFWQFRLPAGRYNLRPAEKGFTEEQRGPYRKLHVNLKHRRSAAYTTVRWLNVHTSPGRSTPTIHQQVNQILGQQQRIMKRFPNTGSSGDFYAQRGSRRNFKRLTQGDDGLKLIHPGVNTNFKKGEGKQIADHFLLPDKWSRSRAFPIAPFRRKGTESLARKLRRGKSERKLSKWEESGIDHSLVYGFSQVPADPIERAIQNVVQRYLQQQQYRTNNCLIHAIATASGVQLTNELIQQIRNALQQRGTAIGDFIEASDANIAIIMRALGLYGNVQIVNVDNIDHAAAPVYVGWRYGATSVNITINYSRYHFYATPGR